MTEKGRAYLKRNCFKQTAIYGMSYPPREKGWHRKILQMLNAKPLNIPYFLRASTAYEEHVGQNLHAEGKRGETANLQSFIIEIIINKNTLLIIIKKYLPFLKICFLKKKTSL